MPTVCVEQIPNVPAEIEDGFKFSRHRSEKKQSRIVAFADNVG